LAAWKQFCSGPTNAREIDLGTISPILSPGDTPSMQGLRYFCCVAGVGLDGEVARRANQLPRWLRGNGGYVLSVVPTIFTFAPFPLKILEQDVSTSNWGIRTNGTTLLAVFANTPLYGGGMKVAPKAKVNDGLLDVCKVGAVSPLRLFRLFPTVYTGRHLKIREAEYFQASRLRVETEYPMDVYADGEYVCRTPIEVSIQRAALKVISPA
jgi:diacylglycerol kinase (ATP)